MEEFDKEKVSIAVGKYIDFNEGWFKLNSDASEIIYRVKGIICSYSGAAEWCNVFFCSLIDLYSGSSPYNYALGTTDHKKEIAEIWKTNPRSVVEWLNKSSSKDWFIRCVQAFEFVFENLPTEE